MVDVEMSDAPTAVKRAEETMVKGPEGKKRFEVKKVSSQARREPGLFLTLPSGMLLLCGLGTSLWITALFAATISWTYVCFQRTHHPSRHDHGI